MKRKRLCLCLLLCLSLVLCQAFSSLADIGGDNEFSDVDAPTVEEIPGDPTSLLDDVPMLFDVNTPLDEFQRLPTLALSNDAIGGLRFGNSISASGGYSTSYYVNCVPAYNTPGAHEIVFEYIFNSPVDHTKFYLDSANKPVGFSISYRRLYASGVSTFTSVAGISYIDDYTVRVSVTFAESKDHEFLYTSVGSSAAYDGVTFNVYSRKINDYTMIGGDGGGGSGSGSGAAT